MYILLIHITYTNYTYRYTNTINMIHVYILQQPQNYLLIGRLIRSISFYISALITL